MARHEEADRSGRRDRDEVDEEIEERSSGSQLGKFRREFLNKESRFYPWAQSGCSIIGIIACSVLMVLAQVTFVRVVLGVVALGAGIMGAALIIDLVRGHTQVVRILLHSHGFIYRDGPTTRCLWTDIAELRNIVPGVRNESPGVRLHNGTELTFNERISDLPEFVVILVKNVSKNLSKEIVDTLQEGGRISFGQRLHLAEEGLEVDKNLHHWKEIAQVRLRTTRRRKGAANAFDPALSQMGAVGYLMTRTASPEKRSTVLQVILRNGDRTDINQNELSNVPVLVDLLRLRYKVEVESS